jgi:hypothetical protein
MAIVLVLVCNSSAGADVHGIPLPRGSRVVERGGDLFSSGRGFRKTVRYYQRFLDRKGMAHRAIPTYRYRGTAVARFLSKDKASTWLAIHVFRRRGKTHVFVVPRPPLDPARAMR